MTKITQEDIENAEVYGRTPEEMAAAREQIELAPGTYKFQIAAVKVEIVSKENKLKGAIQANLQLKPRASDGSIVKRYGSVFKRITAPFANNEFKPEGPMLTIGLADMKWLSEQTGVSQRDLVTSFKRLQVPAAILMKDVVGRFTVTDDEKSPDGKRRDVKPAKASDKLTPLAADATKAASSASAPAQKSDDNSVPF